MKLEGIKILDMTRLLPGPYATMLLADMGAEVIKIEDPYTGDHSRKMKPFIEGEGAPFLMLNRNKKSVGLDLKNEEGREIFLKLAEDADVVFEQFRPGVVEKLGVDYPSVKKVNPDVIYCSLSGYGRTGSFSRKGGHDLNYTSEAGFIDLTRSKDGEPAIPGFPLVMVAGLFSALSIMGALLHRELHDPKGEYIDISILDCLISLSSGIAGQPLLKDETPRAGETELTGKYPFYDIYETKDGRYFCLAAYENKYWQRFCELVGRDGLKDKQFSEGEERKRIKSILEEEFKKRTFKEWEELSKEKEAMLSPVKDLGEVLQGRYVRERDLIGSLDFGGKIIEQVGFPARFTEEDIDEFRRPPPRKGEHTEEVLKKAGYTEQEIRSLRDVGAI